MLRAVFVAFFGAVARSAYGFRQDVEPLPPTSLSLTHRQLLRYALRTTAAAIATLLIARACRLPEVVWAVVTTIVVMQSTLGGAWDVSRQRFIGTVLGGAAAMGLVLIFQPGIWPFLIGMLVLGVVCSWLGLQTSAYRFAGITLALIMLAKGNASIWVMALHRLLEVIIGIAVGMAVMSLWPGIIGAAPASPPKKDSNT
jgi:uncharacterized membrane protein YccC